MVSMILIQRQFILQIKLGIKCSINQEVRIIFGFATVVECRTCNRKVAGSNLSWEYVAPTSTQLSIPPGSVNEDQLWLGRQRQVWLIPLADEMQGVQVKLCYLLTMRATPERLRDVSCIQALYKPILS